MFSSKDSKTQGTTATGNGSAGGKSKATGVPSIISPDLKIIGDLKSSGDIQIDGCVEGDIHSRTLTIGQSAEVQGSIVADTVRISGTVIGQIKAKEVTLEPSAKMTGDITHENLTMEAGAFLEGHVRRMQGGTFAGGDSKVAPLRPSQTGNGPDTGHSETRRPIV